MGRWRSCSALTFSHESGTLQCHEALSLGRAKACGIEPVMPSSRDTLLEKQVNPQQQEDLCSRARVKGVGERGDLKEADSEASRERFTLPELERREKLLELSASDPLCDSGWPVLPSLGALSPLVGLLLPKSCPDLCPDGLPPPKGCPALFAVDGLSSCAPGGSRRSLRRLCDGTGGTPSCKGHS